MTKFTKTAVTENLCQKRVVNDCGAADTKDVTKANPSKGGDAKLPV